MRRVGVGEGMKDDEGMQDSLTVRECGDTIRGYCNDTFMPCLENAA